MAADTTVLAKQSQANGSVDTKPKKFNPYETNPDLVPKDDPFRLRSVQYGRYRPQKDDFHPRYNDWSQSDPEAINYWEQTVKSLWTPENSLKLQGTREAYAAGSVIIRVDQGNAIDALADKFSCVNANELSASRKAEDTLKELGISVPKIYFCGTISGKNVTVETRIPGVSLDVAWRYLAVDKIEALKQQCRRVLQRLSGVGGSPGHPSYVCSGLNSHQPSKTQGSERDLLFNATGKSDDLSLVHNNMVLANIIVNNDRVVGITGWRESGYFGFERANKVHRLIRVPQMVSSLFLESDDQDIKSWADLYEGLCSSPSENGSTNEHGISTHPVKTEPSSMNLDKVPLSEETRGLPQLDGADFPEEHPTPRKVASLKNQGNSRASSSDRSSPALSIKPGAGPAKRPASAATKKGIGKKSIKKRKLEDQDNESVSSRRSNTPLSSRPSKTPGVKKQSSASISSSPAPESKRKFTKKTAAEEDDDSDDNDEIFCICRRPDNHTWMIGCDGGCEDWFHGKCVNIDPRDSELIDKYICPNCKENGKGWTTWKPMCRLKECRKAARFNRKNPSKYCSDEHGLEFMRQKAQHLNLTPRMGSQKPISIQRAIANGIDHSRDDDSEFEGSHIEDGVASVNGDKAGSMEDLGSRGGILTAGDLAAVVMRVVSAQEFRKLGANIVSPPPEDKDTDAETNSGKKLGLDVHIDDLNYSPDETHKIAKLRKRRDELHHRKDMLTARNAFLALLRQRSKSILEVLKKKDPKGGWKDICGFDSRLAWSDEEFDQWRLSDIGKKALEEGTAEALALSYPTSVDEDGDTAMDGVNAEDELAVLSRGVCTKKRCERHKQWLKVQQQDLLFEENTLVQDLAECEKEAQNVVERVVLRMWAEKDNAQNGS
ncbi:hypothetical protein P175DRAFT_0530843 [Aspergillus ochraceoroseus IBT 24754]|uniref:PHD-type domain-containing protein n=1 Tax=Aspergillus ochraceoroseus IBT 24754 TaxID=1392256 RepID=A0A2T5LYI5_9EURO|nr:uncharacterized protein P175DRAFT_0530843 [Aspergillus ochraceoroseus IBT 24754]PTU21347.1 hypothetical protein P175DRAFT_0530843 [Aspergillus ochraceoroseus IBT 24754]